MRITPAVFGIDEKSRRTIAIGMVGLLIAATSLGPAAAAKSGGEERELIHRRVDRPGMENLQRWVVAGHEQWCKDPRLVAANELTRIVADFGGDAMELMASEPDAARSRTQMTFTWAPLDGRAIYRITVERFAWLLPIAKDVDGMVWAPTIVEIQNGDTPASGEDPDSSTRSKTKSERMRLSRS